MMIVPTGKQNDGAHRNLNVLRWSLEVKRPLDKSFSVQDWTSSFFWVVRFSARRISWDMYISAKCQCFLDAWFLTRCLCSNVGILWDNATGVYSLDKHRNLVPTSLLFAEIIVIMIVTQNSVSNSWFIQCFVREMHHIFLKYTNKKIKRAPAKHECPPTNRFKPNWYRYLYE